jgi:RNA polymerase sigma-70 factor (ECF subfamily)
MMNRKEEAEDMLQESFAEAFHHLDDYRFESSFGAWLKRITINKCINSLKKRKAQLIPVEDVPDTPISEDDNTDVPGLTVERIQKAMVLLPEGYRIVFSLYLLEGYDHAEISMILGISEATSKSQYCRAKQKIKEIIISQKYEGQL